MKADQLCTSNLMLRLCSLGACGDASTAQQPLGSHDVENENLVSVVPVKDAARGLDDLAISRPPKLLRPATTLRVVDQLLDMAEDALDKRGCSNRIFERNVVCDGIQIPQRWL